MRASLTRDGLTVRVIAGTYNIILGIDLEHDQREGCLGFSIRRVDLGPARRPYAPAERKERWLPNMLRFASDKSDPARTPITTLTAPLQKFRWGDYTCSPGFRYRYQVVPRYRERGKLTPTTITDDLGVSVEITTEDTANPSTQVFFNRAAAASRAFDQKFGKTIRTEKQLLADTEDAQAAKRWLSRGLEESTLDFLARAKDGSYQLHVAMYEFQKASLLAGIKAAKGRGADVDVVYHHRVKSDADHTAQKNDAAIKLAKLPASILSPRKANPQAAIMHNKFVVLLKKSGKAYKPVAVLLGSTNWTDGGVYGQLNVTHIINDAAVATTYEQYWQLLKQDLVAEDMRNAVEQLTPVSQIIPPAPGMTPLFSPQSTSAMLHSYANVCASARCVLICAPFTLSPIILNAFTARPPQPLLRYFLLDTEGSLGRNQEVRIIENDPSNSIGIATTLSSALHDFQGHLLEGKEAFRHAGIHIHSKLLLVNPFGTDPILIFGSANFSHNSTEVNDSNSLVIRGNTAVADIYATEFMRMFETYHFRAWVANKLTKLAKAKTTSTAKKPKAGRKAEAILTLGLKEDDSWSQKYYVAGSSEALDRMMFAGTLH